MHVDGDDNEEREPETLYAGVDMESGGRERNPILHQVKFVNITRLVLTLYFVLSLQYHGRRYERQRRTKMDARSLLRAKKAEARIAHPYASYSAAGQLRCTICAIPGMSASLVSLFDILHETITFGRHQSIDSKRLIWGAVRSETMGRAFADKTTPYLCRSGEGHSRKIDQTICCRNVAI